MFGITTITNHDFNITHKILKINLEKQNYIINNVSGFAFTEYLQLMRTKYELKEVLFRENDLHPDLKEFFIEVWDTIKKVDIKKAFEEQNQEKKRIYFHCIKPENIFKNTKSKLLSTETLTKKKQNGTEYTDVYRLYSCDGEQFGLNNKVYYVNCFCPSTDREYFIFIEDRFCEKTDYMSKGFVRSYNKDITAIDAIACTLRTNVIEEAVECYYRQGDVLITKIKPEWENKDYLIQSTVRPFRHLTKQEYLTKLLIET